MYKVKELFVNAYRFLGNVFVVLFNIVCSFVIVGVNIYASFNHTLQLFGQVEWTEGIGLAVTIGCELAFIQSSVNMMICALRNRKPKPPIVFVFILGTALIMWSNIASTMNSPSHVVVCVLLGLVPPLMMWGSKGVLADSLMMKEERPQEKMSSEQVAQVASEQISSEQISSEQISSEQISPEQISSEQTGSEQTELEQTKSEQTESEQTELEQTELEQTELEQTELEQTEPEQTESKQTRGIYTDEDLYKIECVALEHEQVNGKLPSMRTLAETAECKNHVANRVLKSMKQQRGLLETAV